MDDVASLLALAVRVARQAGHALKEADAAWRTVNHEDATDIKMQADVEAEALIRAGLAPSGLALIGEEGGGDATLLDGNALYWVVDPLDGTFNYNRGSPVCAVSIGLMQGREPIAGVIFDFSRDVLLTGQVGVGAHRNGEALRPQWATQFAQAALQTGFPAGLDRDPARLQSFLELVSPFKKIRMIGCASLAAASVATGEGDVYFEPAIRLWDIAAALALVVAVGGTVRMTPSPEQKFLAFDVWMAGNKALLPEA